MARIPRLAVKVVVSLAAVIAIVLFLVQDREVLRIESAVAIEDSRFPDYVAALTGSPLTSGDRYDILVNGVQIFPAMLRAMTGARRRISFETYVYDRGEMAEAFTTALADAARRGVEVRVIIDAVGAKAIERAHVDRLLAAGVQLGTFNPLHWYSITEVNFRTHRKILVVDGEVGFTGGAGVGDQWLGDARTPNEWRDTHLKVVGPAVALLEACFYENWVETGHVGPAGLDLSEPPAEALARSIVVWSAPSGGSSRVKLLYLLTIAAARRTLDIASPYVVLDDSTRWSIAEARRRGVRIRLLVESDLTDAMPVKYASRADYDGLLDAGIEISEYQPTMMHAKALIADGLWSIVGSTNFDNRSFELNDEINVAIADRGVAERLTADFEADLRRSRQLRLETWRARPRSDKARERLWRVFGELF